LLRRNHGGAELCETDDISHRMAINYDDKVKIARKAISFIKDGDTIFVESGSINAIFVKELASAKGITIITSNAFIARNIDQKRGCSVVFPGIDGFTFETGFTGRDMMRAEIASYIVAKGREIFILSDSSKFGQIHVARYCSIEDVHHVITDVGLSDEYRAGISSKVDLILV
jgi:DeoR/GlpR family transcriptional regulator of sugar metabolism